MTDWTHVPILLRQEGEDSTHPDVLDILSPRPHESVLDATLGLGGHAQAFLARTSPDGILTGMEADQENLAIAEERLKMFDGRVRLTHANFREIASLDLPRQDIIFADLGLSSPHLDDPTRGFSFRADAPLDMRFDRTSGATAAEWLQSANEADMRQVFRMYGELREAHRLAHHLYRVARQSPEALATTSGLKNVCESVFTYRTPSVLPQVFQAIRMHINDEIGALTSLLSAAPTLLKPGGRLGIITFHSLEDRLVKQTFRALTTPTKDEITGAVSVAARFELLTKKPLVPDAQEIERNFRARSAKFRAIRRFGTI